mmetsp:Transcript_37154/g.148227  ORF Transcript_37154/g.148227 Transcript_37154/m.148227 type:complete len:975 (-) Transcript_37154:365-3289(-)
MAPDYCLQDYFRETARVGLKEQIGDQYELAHYEDRLEYELQLLIDKGFASYFLIVWDYIRYARENGISVGPGRGSACGSLVAYGLRITEIDPVKHDLLFERFLNPERTSLPDIDTDFSMEGRDRVIRYVTEKYGEDHVAQIITFNRLSSKSVLRDCARVTGIPYAEADKVSKLVPVARGKAIKLETMISDGSPSPEFKNLYETEPKMRDLVDVSMILEGTNRNSGVHAAGVVIGAEPLNTIVPLSRGKNNEVVTQYAMEELEDVGLLKMDFLGLRNLSIIDSTREYVAKKNGENLPILQDLSFSDKRTYDLLSTGEVDGVFQLDASGGMQEIVKKLGPNSISDISSILALYRPGPLDAGLVDTFIDRKHGREPVQFEHPLLESILHETYGVLVYQEQIMQVARDLAGYSLGQADILRRAMGKKKTDVMEHERGRFVSGAVKNNIDRKLAEKLFESMLKFAEYCFNKSHSTAYAYLTFQTAWLKTHYPVEFMASVLRLNSDNMTKLPRYIDDAASQGVVVLAPSVNTSDVVFAPVYTLPSGCKAPSARSGYVGFGLGAIKGIGEVAAQAITDERIRGEDFKSIFDFCARLPSKVAGKRVLENLVQCGAFDDLHENRRAVFNSIPQILDWRKKLDAKRKRAAARLKEGGLSEVAHDLDSDEIVNKIRGSWLEADSDYSVMERYFIEKQLVGFLTSGNLHKEYEGWVRFALPNTLESARGGPQSHAEESEVLDDRPQEAEAKRQSSDHFYSKPLKDGESDLFFGVVTDTKKLFTRNGANPMMKFTLEDATGEIPCVAFTRTYARVKDYLEVGNRVAVYGKVRRDSGAEIHVEGAHMMEDYIVVLAYLENQGSASKPMIRENLTGALEHLATQQDGGTTMMSLRIATIGSRSDPLMPQNLVNSRWKHIVRVRDKEYVRRVFMHYDVPALICPLRDYERLMRDRETKKFEEQVFYGGEEEPVHEEDYAQAHARKNAGNG